jgi:pyruvate dehydrogenase (quinone)
VALAGDARHSLRALLEEFDRQAPGGTGPDDRRNTEWRRQVEQSVNQWRTIREQRAADPPSGPGHGLNPQFVVHELSAQIPHEAMVSVDVGSITYWYARFLQLPPGVPAHLSSTLASMGSAMPFAIAAKLAHPDRPVVALAGDGAMQMNGLLELITVAHRWQQWSDPRFVVLVLHNGDLAEVSWEQREMEGDPRYPVSQAVPSFPYAGYAELLGLRGITVEKPEQVTDAWREALSADRPCLIEAITDPGTPMLAPKQPDEKVEQMLAGLDAEPGGDGLTEAVRRQREQEA